MLTAYVSDHQHDWDKHLPYVLMAYRSAVHETTGYTPTMLMLGREVSTPLNLMYELPSDMKPSNVHDYVWKLRERLEEAYWYTRQISKQSILRQKKYHDQNVVGKHFTVGDEVLVFFPQRKIGKSPKLMNFWYGPYVIEEKHTDTTYKIRKKDSEKTLIVHVDRLRPYGTQVLSNEIEQPTENENCAKDESLSDHLEGDEIKTDLIGNSELSELEMTYSNRRQRRKPKWHSDYEFDYNP